MAWILSTVIHLADPPRDTRRRDFEAAPRSSRCKWRSPTTPETIRLRPAVDGVVVNRNGDYHDRYSAIGVSVNDLFAVEKRGSFRTSGPRAHRGATRVLRVIIPLEFFLLHAGTKHSFYDKLRAVGHGLFRRVYKNECSNPNPDRA